MTKTINLPYQLPYAGQQLFAFLQARIIDGLEFVETLDNGLVQYSRTIDYSGRSGYFEIHDRPERSCLVLNLYLENDAEYDTVIERVKLIFDVGAPINEIDQQLRSQLGGVIHYLGGLRVPGIWGYFEAGVRAILGQQVSVVAARRLVQFLVENLGEKTQCCASQLTYFFPKPEAVVSSDLSFFKMPQARKDCLRSLAQHFLTVENPMDLDAWIDIKGVRPWTINYVKIRAKKDTDIWLVGDAGLNKALKGLSTPLELDALKPWHSYATFQLWNQL